MIVAYEPTCWGLEHVNFNVSFLATVVAAYPDQEITFFAERDHLAAVREKLNEFRPAAPVHWREMEIGPRKRYTIRARFRSEWRVSNRVLGEAEKLAATYVIACSAMPACLLAIKALLILKFRSLRVLAVQHGSVLSWLHRPKGRRLPEHRSAYGFVLVWRPVSRLRYLVLDDPALSNVFRIEPSLRGQMFALGGHPYLFGETAIGPLMESPPRFGFIGAATNRKGFPDFCRVAREAAASFPEDRFVFELVGYVSDPNVRDAVESGALGDNLRHFVEMPQTDTFLDGREYNRHLSRLTYSLLPHDKVTGALTSSASLLDAFAHALPCIAIRNSLFEECFQKMGDIGYLCDTYEEMRDTVFSLIRKLPVERYLEQRRNIIRGRKMLEPEGLAPHLREILFNLRRRSNTNVTE